MRRLGHPNFSCTGWVTSNPAAAPSASPGPGGIGHFADSSNPDDASKTTAVLVGHGGVGVSDFVFIDPIPLRLLIDDQLRQIMVATTGLTSRELWMRDG